MSLQEQSSQVLVNGDESELLQPTCLLNLAETNQLPKLTPPLPAMFIARLFLKSSTYTHKIAINCPGWLSRRLNRFSIWLTYKAVNRALKNDGQLVTYTLPKPICCGKCNRAA